MSFHGNQKNGQCSEAILSIGTMIAGIVSFEFPPLDIFRLFLIKDIEDIAVWNFDLSLY